MVELALSLKAQQGQEARTTLRTTPSASEGSLIDVELWLSKATCAHGTTRVVNLLDDRLGSREVVDEATERVVLAAHELVDERLECERRVSGPGVEVVGVDSAGTSNDDAGLAPDAISIVVAAASNVQRTLAPEESDPSDPMLASTPAFARGVSVEM